MTFGFVARTRGSAGLRGARFQAVFGESSPAGIGWNLWGMLPQSLPQETVRQPLTGCRFRHQDTSAAIVSNEDDRQPFVGCTLDLAASRRRIGIDEGGPVGIGRAALDCEVNRFIHDLSGARALDALGPLYRRAHRQ